MNTPAPVAAATTSAATAAVSAEPMMKKDFQNVQLQEVRSAGGLRLALNSFAELEKFSNFMAISNFVPKHLRTKPADCLAVLLQAMRWEMDPFAVAQKTYFVNDGMAYEAQLVNAIVLSRAKLKNRPKLSWSGEGENLKCKVSAVFEGEDEPEEFEAEIKTISTRNSPLWKQQPKQQLGYFALRAWARLYCPDVLMGVYTKEEREDPDMGYGADNAINITPRDEVIDDITAGIQAEKAASAKPEAPAFDPETGEIIEEKAPEEPSYKLPPLETAADVAAAGKSLITVLAALAPEDRAGVFVQSGGPIIVEAMRKQGEGLLMAKLRELGIALLESEAA